MSTHNFITGITRFVVVTMFLGALVACGGGGGSSSGGSSGGSGSGGGGGSGGTSVASIAVSPASAGIGVGATQQFTAVAKDSSGNTMSGVTFTWASSSSGVATINSSGVATGIAAGSANITASAGGVTSSPVVLTVTAPAVSSIAVSPASAGIGVGATQQFTAVAKDSSGNTMSGVTFTWASSSSGVATINSSGVATGVAAGSANITASAGGVTSSPVVLTVTVIAPVVSSIAVSPASASIASGATQQFTATAKDSAGNPISGVTFSWVSSSTNVATISGSGLATGVAAGSSNITASADGVSSTPAVLTVQGAALSVTTTALPNGNTGTAYSATLQASGGTAPYTWSISSGSLPSWATLNATSGAISGTPSSTGTTSFTVQVADSASPAASATASLSITVGNTNLALLNGQYAFLVSGYDSVVAGSLTLNGSGQVTGGTEDIEAPGAGLTGAAINIVSGSYTLGADNRGTLTYKDANGNSFTFAIASGGLTYGVDDRGHMIETDSNPLEMTGQFNLQTASAFSASAFSGAYAFGFQGWDNTPQPQTLVGSFSVSSSAISAGLLDANDDGNLMANETFTGSLGSVSSDGRGSFTATLGNGHSETFTTYVIGVNDWIAIGTVSGGPVSGQVLAQSGAPFSNSSFNGASIFVDQSENGVPAPHALLGLVTFGASNAFSGTLDENDGGSATGGVTLGVSVSGTWSLTSATNGRFTFTPSGANTLVGYLVGPNEAFLTEAAAVAPDFGTLEPQTLYPGLSNTTLNGSAPAGTLPLLSPGTAGSPPPALNIYSGIFTFNGAGGLSATLDVNSSGAVTSGLTGTDTYSVAANGRVTLASGNYVLWIVTTDPLEIYALQTSQSQPSSANPVVLFMY